MVHNEMSFLFGAVPVPGDLSKPAHMAPIRNNNNYNTGDIFGTINTEKYDRVYKDSKTGRNNNVISEVQNTVYAQDRMTKDPYVSLLDYFNSNSGNGPVSMALQAADFVYLKDLGVYPINRLIILRRYKDGVVVPNNLALFKERPISTVIGWVKFDEANKEMFSFNFNEKWVETSDTLDKVIQKIMKEQFNIRTEMFFPIPAWSQGFLFGMLNNMGLSDYTSTNVPTGDPNVLRTSMMREVESQSLMSELKITFETSYEQKYIDGVDPGLAFQDIIANLARCGTSDMKFVLNGQSQAFQQLFGAVLMGGGGDTVGAWIKLGTTLIDLFVQTIKDFFVQTGNKIAEGWSGVNSQIEQDNKKLSDSKALDERGQKWLEDVNKWQAANPRDKPGQTAANIAYYDAYERNKKKYLQNKSSKISMDMESGTIFGSVNLSKGTDLANGVFNDFVKTILAGSVYKYRWPLIGSIGVMSGLSTTPWHLTVGNPFSPILNMANIVVNNVDMKFSSEMGFNDMPKRVDAVIDIKMARPIGSSEINRMFNNQYGRIYSKAKTPETTVLDPVEPVTSTSIVSDVVKPTEVIIDPVKEVLPPGVTRNGPKYVYPDGTTSFTLHQYSAERGQYDQAWIDSNKK
jgi:hypothetical protein